MKNTFRRNLLLALIASAISSHTVLAQPGPPVDTPPCWPPPCVPVDGGIVFAICAAVLFGGFMIYKSYRLRLSK